MLAYLRSSRIGEVTKAYSCAAIAAGFVMSSGIALAAFSGKPTLSMLPSAGLLALILSAFTIPYTFLLAALPAAGIIIFAERRGIRSPLFYGVMGVFAAAAAVLGFAVFVRVMQIMSGVASAPGGPATDWIALAASYAVMVLLFGVPGVVGGLTYWAKAGRDAS